MAKGDLQETAIKNGFESEAEMYKLIAAVPLNNAGAIYDFKQWQHNDGTKAGLLLLFPSEKDSSL